MLAHAATGELLEPIVTTDDHPVWVEEANDWVPVGRLVEGWTLTSLDGPLVVYAVLPTGRTDAVFNFEVEQLHSYHVGVAPILVHNASAPCPKLPVPGTGKKAGRAHKAKVRPGQPGAPKKVSTKPVKKSDALKEAGRDGRHGGVVTSKTQARKAGGRMDGPHQDGLPHGHPPDGKGHAWYKPKDGA